MEKNISPRNSARRQCFATLLAVFVTRESLNSKETAPQSRRRPRPGAAMSGTRDECVFMARLAEQAERFEDMVELLVEDISSIFFLGHKSTRCLKERLLNFV